MTAVLRPEAAVAADLDTLPRLLLRDGEGGGLADHLHRHGGVPYRGGRGLLVDTLDQAGLTGRGGAGFPAGRKWRAVAGGRGQALVVGNGAEGEPASSKDRVLLDSNPHLVLDGLQLAAEAVGAPEAVLYLHPHPQVQARVWAALQERPDDRVPVELVVAADRFLAGEESAVVDALEDGPGLPRSTPPRVFQKGVSGRPTLVQNVESLAHVALLARYGAGWFRQVGTEAEPGSMLTTVRDGSSSDVFVAEVPLGTPLRDLVPLGDDVQAVLLGGYHGAWIPVADARRLQLSRTSLAGVGATPGAGVVVTLPTSTCGLVESTRVMVYLAAESAGQCGPCLNGLPRIALTMEDITAGRADPRALAAVHRWAGLVDKRGACHHPDGSMRFLRSALTTFSDEVRRHLGGRCSAPRGAAVLPVPAARRAA